MKRQNQCAPQFSEVALACGLVFSLLPGTAAAQDGADKRPVTETGLPDMPMKTPVENPVRENYRICNGGTIDSETDHHSMDQCAAYFAVRGAQTGLQRVTAHGSWVLGAGFNTYNVWNSNINNPMHFKVVAILNSDLGKAIDALMGELPIAISITSPRGGEAWEAGAKHDIKWTTKGDIPRVSIAYTTDGAAWKGIAEMDNTGSYTWTVPKDGSATVRLKVSAIPEAVVKGVSGQIEIEEPTNR